MKTPNENELFVGCVWCGESMKESEEWTRDDENLLIHPGCRRDQRAAELLEYGPEPPPFDHPPGTFVMGPEPDNPPWPHEPFYRRWTPGT